MLRLYQSNQLERLADRLGEVISEPLDDLFTPETIVVQHQGMGRWLSLQLADRLGICANINFPLPAGFIWQVLELLLPDVPPKTRFNPGAMRWAVFQLLNELKGEGAFAPVRAYFDKTGENEQFQLATQLANSLDQYLVYRPDWIRAWESGQSAVTGDEWQAALWRKLSEGREQEHWVGIQQQLYAREEQGQLDGAALPGRLCLFGISSLSPGFLSLLAMLARFTDVHLFLLNPCEAYWTDIVAEKERHRRELEVDGADLYLEVGHPLLASMGQQGRDFFALLQEFDPGSEDLFELPEGGGLLQQIQGDILQLIDPTLEAPRPFDPKDRSLMVHAAHSPMREVEILRDQLLAMLDADPELQPSEILVMTPDMDTYAPYVEAVFGDRQAGVYLNFSIADRSVIAQYPLVEAFMRLLEMPGSRYDANSLLALLEVAAVQRRFGLNDGDLPRITEWVREAGIRWGKDRGTRQALGLPETDQNSWRAGLERMLLGLALPDEQRLFAGVLPFDGIEGSSGLILGGLSAFVEAVFDLEGQLGGVQRPEQWAATLATMLDRFFLADDDEETQLQVIREGLLRLVEEARMAAFEQPVGLKLVRELLASQFESIGGRSPFLGGGITFCALTPMRSLPFKVVCMIGMNDGAFPRDRRPPGFDLMGGQLRIGDRSHRADDRYLFLETLISTRQCLYLSYVGQDIRDNSPIPPSVLVSELLDYIDRCYVAEEGMVSAQLLVRHPLQPFNPRYFTGDERLFSYSEIMCQAAATVSGEAGERQALLVDPLPEPEAEWRQVELGQLIAFFEHPARYLIQRRLGLLLAPGESILDTRDPFELDYFARGALLERLVERQLQGEESEALFQLELAAGALPHGAFGEHYFARLREQAQRFAETLAQWRPAEEGRRLDLDFQHGGLRLMGMLSGITPQGLFGFSVEKLPDSRFLGLWVRHLALNLCAPDDVTAQTRWLDGQGGLIFTPVADAGACMEDLLALYWQGLQQPLHLFPKASRRYAERLHNGKPPAACLAAANERWRGEFNAFPEYADRYYQLAFPTGEVLDSSFQQLAERVYEPIFAHMEVI